MAEASLRISPASTTRLSVRIAAVSGSLRTISMARRMPEMRSRRRCLSGLSWRRSSGSASRLSLEDRHDIEQAMEIAFEEGGRRHRPFIAGGRDGDEVAGQIAAVDGRHIERVQRRQRPGFVPVVEMAAIGLQLLDRGDGGFQPLGRVGEPDPAEIARRQDRQQVDADIGRRGARRHDRRRDLLEIVRRQHVVLRRDEGLEIEPGAASDGAQLGLVGLRDDQPVFGLRRAADQPCESRRPDPEQGEDASPTPTPVEPAASGMASPASPITTAPYIMR